MGLEACSWRAPQQSETELRGGVRGETQSEEPDEEAEEEAELEEDAEDAEEVEEGTAKTLSAMAIPTVTLRGTQRARRLGDGKDLLFGAALKLVLLVCSSYY